MLNPNVRPFAPRPPACIHSMRRFGHHTAELVIKTTGHHVYLDGHEMPGMAYHEAIEAAEIRHEAEADGLIERPNPRLGWLIVIASVVMFWGGVWRIFWG